MDSSRRLHGLTCLRPEPQARLRLITFPYAGGGTAAFRPWVGAPGMPAGVELWAAELPGRERRLLEPALDDIGAVTALIVSALAALRDRPYVFFGHSMGALISFEVARALRRQGAPLPRQMFLSGHRAAHLPYPRAPIHALPAVDFVEALRRLNGSPEEVLQNAELMELCMPALRADFKACETYRYQAEAPLPIPFAVYGGLADPDVHEDDLVAWRTHTTGAFALTLFPGDHFFLNTAQAALLTQMRAALTL